MCEILPQVIVGERKKCLTCLSTKILANWSKKNHMIIVLPTAMCHHQKHVFIQKKISFVRYLICQLTSLVTKHRTRQQISLLTSRLTSHHKLLTSQQTSWLVCWLVKIFRLVSWLINRLVHWLVCWLVNFTFWYV